jgi:hypothetical protein
MNPGLVKKYLPPDEWLKVDNQGIWKNSSKGRGIFWEVRCIRNENQHLLVVILPTFNIGYYCII